MLTALVLDREGAVHFVYSHSSMIKGWLTTALQRDQLAKAATHLDYLRNTEDCCSTHLR